MWLEVNKNNSYLKLLKKFLRALIKNPGLLFKYIKYRDFYCGDDWNYWWTDKFEDYKLLPMHFEKSLEIGCGPYTNIRLISKQRKIKEIYCCDPLINIYKSFRLTWLAIQASKNKIKINSDNGTYIFIGQKL